MSRLFLILGACSAALGVAAGAFGAHALRARVEPRLLEVFETGARYQMYHAFALIAAAWVGSRAVAGQGLATVAGWWRDRHRSSSGRASGRDHASAARARKTGS